MESNRIKDLKAVIEALVIAEGREKRSYDFYVKAATKAQNPAAKVLLLDLAEEENQHRQEMEKRIEEFKTELGREFER